MLGPGGSYLSAVRASRLLRRGDSAHRAGQYVHECNVTHCFVLSRLAESCIIKNQTIPIHHSVNSAYQSNIPSVMCIYEIYRQVSNISRTLVEKREAFKLWDLVRLIWEI